MNSLENERKNSKLKLKKHAPSEHEVSINEIKANTSWIQNFFHPNIYKVATVTFANGGDNIGVYIPFFTTYKGWQIGIIVLIFLFLVAVWCYIANKLIAFPLAAQTLERYGHIIVPFVLIGLGALILYENGTLSYFIDKLTRVLI